MSNVAWCDLNNNIILRLHHIRQNPLYKCQKQAIFTPKQFQMEGTGFKDRYRKFFKGTQAI